MLKTAPTEQNNSYPIFYLTKIQELSFKPNADAHASAFFIDIKNHEHLSWFWRITRGIPRPIKRKQRISHSINVTLNAMNCRLESSAHLRTTSDNRTK